MEKRTANKRNHFLHQTGLTPDKLKKICSAKQLPVITQTLPVKPATQHIKVLPQFNYDVTFIVPIRDREHHKQGFIDNIKQFYGHYKYEIIFVYQDDCGLFKRGQLCNIGFVNSNGRIIVFHDIDIRHFRPINFEQELQKYHKPLLAFSEISQIENGQVIEQFELLEGYGGCNVFSREQFVKSGGFSNLFLGWGGEDNLLHHRAKFYRLKQNIGHIKHGEEFRKVLNKGDWYDRNVKILKWLVQNDINDDGFMHTTADTNTHKYDNITEIHCKNIEVTDDFRYKYLLNKRIEVAIVPDVPNWAFDNIAEAIIKYNPFPTEIKYTKFFASDLRDGRVCLDTQSFDYIFVMFEGETIVPISKKIIKGCYSAGFYLESTMTSQTLGIELSKCRHVVFVNKYLAKIITPFLRTPSSIITDASDDEIFKPNLSEKEEDFTVIFVGNYQRAIKRYDLIQEACKKADVVLKTFKTLTKQQLAKEYCKAHLCINFSIFEGGPQVMCESALCECPMLITKDIGLSTEIPCFTAASFEELVKQLIHLKHNKNLCELKGKEARIVALNNFLYKQKAKEFAELFINIYKKDRQI